MSSINYSSEIVFGSAEKCVSTQISKAEKEGRLRKIAPRLYTTNLYDAAEHIVRRNFFDILKWRFPNTVISHRSASELRPTADGNFFITGSYTRKITDLPGLTLHVLAGKPALDSDVNLGGIYISSEWRQALEAMQPSRKAAGEAKNFPVEHLEAKLEKIILREGDDGLNRFRDKARTVAEQLGFADEFRRLNAIIAALLSTHQASVLSSASAKARAAGQPFDAARIELFEILFDSLKSYYFPERRDRNVSESAFRLFSFFEAYFSNYIEGTKFVVEEAKSIVDTGVAMPKRVKDSHDILGTYRLVSSRHEMRLTPATPDELLHLLKRRHAVMMAGRADDVNAGQFKERNNRAGQTEFVDHTLVEGTLRQSFRYYAALAEPMARAVYLMFVVAEVHPFTDGNGRMSRIMGNAELYKGGQSRIVVPTVFRDDYLLALKRFTNAKEPDAYIRVMDKLQRFSSNIFGENFSELNRYLQACDAYSEATEGHLKFIERSAGSE